MSLKIELSQLGTIIGGGFFMNACGSMLYKAITDSVLFPVPLQFVATGMGMILGYYIAMKAQKEKEND